MRDIHGITGRGRATTTPCVFHAADGEMDVVSDLSHHHSVPSSATVPAMSSLLIVCFWMGSHSRGTEPQWVYDFD